MADVNKTIALFGGTGSTGSQFLKLAIDAGYTVRALVRTPSKVPPLEAGDDRLTIIEGDIKDEAKVKETVAGADYVVSMLGLMNNLTNYPTDMLLNFIKMLQPILVENKIKVFLYQAGAYNKAPSEEKLPRSMWFMRKVSGWIPAYMGMENLLVDHEHVFDYLEESNLKKDVNVIVTRPGGLRQGDSNKTLQALSSPSMGMITFVDLARFSLQALEKEELYGKYPYVG